MRRFEREMVKDDFCGKEMSERDDSVVKTRDINLYSLPPSIHFPDSAQPSCGVCEKDLLGVFGGSLGSSASSQPNTDSLLNLGDTSSIIGLKSTYADAVQTVQRTCGQNLVQTAQASSSGVDANVAAGLFLSPRTRMRRVG
ncbi:hypothetical protein VKT23_011949 [Stygiomarasmius scandens]|uniref:DUF7729 domain-containing protein n=1 Tax=Marasmiellus scandens TaxID=2682957 RepID=A0ABR1JC06_9AGAR